MTCASRVFDLDGNCTDCGNWTTDDSGDSIKDVKEHPQTGWDNPVVRFRTDCIVPRCKVSAPTKTGPRVHRPHREVLQARLKVVVNDNSTLGLR